MVYETSYPELLDAICFKHYGRENAVEQVLHANRFLAERGSVIPQGVKIILPKAEQQKIRKTIALWD